MALRDALRQSRLVTFALLFAVGWLLLSAVRILSQMGPIRTEEFVGQSGWSGLVGVLVIAAAVALGIVLYSELGQTSPAPEPWTEG
jgi:hypothetical protein